MLFAQPATLRVLGHLHRHSYKNKIMRNLKPVEN